MIVNRVVAQQSTDWLAANDWFKFCKGVKQGIQLVSECTRKHLMFMWFDK